MSNRTHASLIRRSSAIAVTSLLALAVFAVAPASLGAASDVQHCNAPLPTAQSGRQTFLPGINGVATAQKVTSKVNLFQCSDPSTGRSGVLTTAGKTEAVTCDVFSTAHVCKFAATITWSNGKTSTLKLSYATSGASRLANVTGTVTAGVYAKKSVTAQFKWKPVVGPNSKKYPDACANTVAPKTTGRIRVTGDVVSTIKPFTVH
jgi:hypothetical protein